jgi:hypothetical protein
VLEVGLSTEILVVRIGDPQLHEALIRQRLHVLEHQQSGNPSARAGHLSAGIAVQRAPMLLEQFPLHRVRHSNQGVFTVDEIKQRGAAIIKEPPLLALRGGICLGLYRLFPYCKKQGLCYQNTAIPEQKNTLKPLYFKAQTSCSGSTP